ncbi:immunoglobulin superfamily member 6 isoform X2 [Cebus imitator]|uniref:immunoglobulin superfamily member 6 isoform X2 n=1 Tax=Cebus imitator TaxID=2715852 RepID=UPI00080A37B7|nr:immunoglobulin superfamily member 6 isoform X2 [Cebus imitator]
MGTVSRSNLAHHLQTNLILFYVGVVGACTVSITQPQYLEVDYTYKAVTIKCTFFATGCPSERPTHLWFRYGAHQPENLCLDGCKSEADKFTVREAPTENHVSLTVNRVTSNDSAIYICGIAFPSALEARAKQTGGGTTLVVREIKLISKELWSVLTALISLLSVYVTGVCVAFILLSKLWTSARAHLIFSCAAAGRNITCRGVKIQSSKKQRNKRRLTKEEECSAYFSRNCSRTIP